MPALPTKAKTRSLRNLSRQFQSGEWHVNLVDDARHIWQDNPNPRTLTLLLRIQQAIRGFQPDELQQIVDTVLLKKQAVAPAVVLRLSSLLSQYEQQGENLAPTQLLSRPSNFAYKLRRQQLLSRYPRLLKDHPDLRQANLAEAFCKRMANWTAYTRTLDAGRIAIVGNAVTELGKHQGNRINQATHVFRFNNINTDGEFAADYGTKTTAWVISPSFKPNPEKLAASTLLVSGIDPFHKPTAYWRHLATLPVKQIVTFPSHVWYQLVAELEAPPTAGLLTLASLIDSGMHSAGMSVYGISRTVSKNRQNHYGDRGTKSSRHNWRKEAEIANRLISKIELAESNC